MQCGKRMRKQDVATRLNHIIGEQSRRQNRGELLHESLLTPASGRERHAEARLGLLRRDGAQHQELRRRPEVHEEDQCAK